MITRIKKGLLIALAILFLVSGSSALASVITNAQYYGQIMNTASSDLEDAIGCVVISVPDLIDLGMINSTATDCAMQYASGQDMPFMPGNNSTNPWVYLMGDMQENTTKYSYVYTGGVTGGNLVHFTGADGWETTDDADLELGDNFTITLSNVWIDTTAGADKFIFSKPGALSLWVDPSTSGKLRLQSYAFGTGTPFYILPNGAGTYTNIPSASPAVTHYLNMDDPVGAPDDATTMVYFSGSAGTLYDTYNMEDYSLWQGSAQESLAVTWYGRDYWGGSGGTYPKAYLGGSLWTGSFHAAIAGWETYSQSMPRPGGGTWTTTDIDNIEAGIALYVVSTDYQRASQVYLRVTYNYTDESSIYITGVDTGEHDITITGLPADILDDFEWGIDGDPLSDSGGELTWSVTAPGSSVVDIDTSQAYSGTRSARIYRDGTNNVYTSTPQSALQPGEIVSFQLMKDANADFVFAHGNDTYCAYVYIPDNETVYYYDGSAHSTGESISELTWTEIGVTNFDFTSHTYDIYLDGVLIQEDATMLNNPVGDDVLLFQNQDGTSEVWIDDVQYPSSLTLDVDGDKETSYLLGAVRDTADNIVTFENDTCMYAGSQEIEVDGVQKQYVDWEYTETGTFQDSSAYDNDADVDYLDTCTDNLTETLSIFTAYSVNSGGVASVPDTGLELLEGVPDDPELTNQYDPEGSPDGFLGQGVLEDFAESAHIPPLLLIYIVAFGSAIILGLVAYGLTAYTVKAGDFKRQLEGSLLVQSLVSLLVMVYFVTAGDGVIPGLALIPFGIEALVVLIWRLTPSPLA